MKTEIQKKLFALQDLKYRDFNAALLPTVNKETVIGVRTPEIRKLAKMLAGTKEAEEFLQTLPHEYYEENNLHGCLIEQIKEYDKCIEALNAFLPYVDNWGTCDLMSPKVLKNHLSELLEQIKIWMASEHIYTVRFGIEMLMRYYLDEEFKPEYLEWVTEIRAEEYYLKMMVAWYFATALAKQYETALPFIEKRKLEKWTHNKAIQKAVESYRITDEQKIYLKTLKWK